MGITQTIVNHLQSPSSACLELPVGSTKCSAESGKKLGNRLIVILPDKKQDYIDLAKYLNFPLILLKKFYLQKKCIYFYVKIKILSNLS